MASEMLVLSTPIQHSCVGVDNTSSTEVRHSMVGVFKLKFINVTKFVIIVLIISVQELLDLCVCDID